MLPRQWLVLASVAAIFFFASATTFQTLGLVAFAMLAEFHWSEAEAGGAFLALGLACCASSPLPIALIPRIGARWTVVLGAGLLAVGFLIAAQTRTLATFYLAAGFFGVAFSLIANTSGIYLIAGWFGHRAPRMIGLYLMTGTLGGAIGPPVVQWLISSSGGWRLHWLLMTAMAILLGGLCAVFIAEPPAATATSADRPAGPQWGLREALWTPQFAVIAAAMVATQTCLLTIDGVTPSHFFRVGLSDAFTAQILGLQALIGTAATGISGWLTERYDPKRMLAAGLLAESVGVILLAFTHTSGLGYLFAVFFGVGWSVTCLTITVLLIRYFGNRVGPSSLSAIWMLSGIAAAGPSVAGMVADSTGSFAPALAGLGFVLVPIVFAIIMMTTPRRSSIDGVPPNHAGTDPKDAILIS